LQIRVGGDFQRHAVTQDGVADFGCYDAAHHALRLAVGRGIGEGAELPELVRLQFSGERHLQRVAEFQPRHFLVGRQRETEDLIFGNLPRLGIICGDGF
jgi:hypothetical protein